MSKNSGFIGTHHRLCGSVISTWNSHFLKNYIRQFQPSEVLFTLFNDKLLFSIPFRSEVDDLESVFDFLRQFKPYGGTQLGNLDLSDPEGAPVLLFTDGYNSFGRKIPKQAVPLFMPFVPTGISMKRY